MSSGSASGHAVFVVGAGPSGIFLAGTLAEQGVEVLLLNRDIKPGGLVEYGIFPTKYKLKGGIRKQIAKVFAQPNIHYLGNVAIGQGRVLTLDELRALRPSAIAITTGAQGMNSLGIPGENRPGAIQSKDLVYHYTELPPYSVRQYPIGKRVLVVGMGNVAVDITHYLVRVRKVEEVTIMARRGPAERKYTAKEVAVFGANFDLTDLDAELTRIEPQLRAAGQDPAKLRGELRDELQKAPLPRSSETRVRFRFLMSPEAFLGKGSDGAIEAVRVAHNCLKVVGDQVQCQATGATAELPYDTVIFAVGDRVEEGLGLPVTKGHYVTSEGLTDAALGPYEVRDPRAQAPLDGIFVAGWSRRPSDGLVGIAKQDGVVCAGHLLTWLAGRPKDPNAFRRMATAVEERILARGIRAVRRVEFQALERAEAAQAKARGLEEYRFPSNEEMLAAITAELGQGG